MLPPTNPNGDVATQERPLYLLDFFSLERPLWTLSALARASGLPKASCFRALRVLEKYRLVQRDGEAYRLGARLIALGSLVQESHPARRVALAHLERLRDETGHTAQWTVLDGREGVYTEVVQAHHGVRLYMTPGRRVPLHGGAAARLLLAFAPPPIAAEVLAGPLPAVTERTPTDRETLAALVEDTRRSWLAASFGELVPYSAELAAPVWGARGFVAAVSVGTAEAAYADRAVLARDARLLDAAAQAISRDLGFVGPWPVDAAGFARSLSVPGAAPC